jgi:hypothetical protein
MAQITADFDFAYFAYDFEEDFAFEQLVACNSSGPNRTNSHDGNRYVASYWFTSRAFLSGLCFETILSVLVYYEPFSLPSTRVHKG